MGEVSHQIGLRRVTAQPKNAVGRELELKLRQQKYICQLSGKNHVPRLIFLLALLVSSSLAHPVRVSAQNISFDSNASSGAFYPTLDPMISPTLTWSHTIGITTDRILVVGISTTTITPVSSPSDRVTSVTYGSTSLTRIGTRVASDQRSAVEMFQLVSPSPGSNDITVTLVPAIVSYVVGGSVSFFGVDQTTPERAQASGVFASNSGTSMAPTVNVTSAATDLVFDTVATLTDAGFLTPDLSQTLLWNGRQFFANVFDVGAGSIKAGVSLVTMLWSISNSAQPWAIGAVSLRSSTRPTAAPGSIAGEVRTSEGIPLGGVTVTLSGADTRRTITNRNGAYFFSNVETGGLYSVTPSRANYVFSPASRAFSLMADKTDAVFTATQTSETANPLDTSPEFFVRQHYLDFLGRESDQAGLEYWSTVLRECGADAPCANARRVGVSAAFFNETEFQHTASFIYRLYQGALGRQLSYREFSNDRSKVIGGANLEPEKIAFADEFVQRREFIEKYQSQPSAEAFVDALLQTMQRATGVDLSRKRETLIAAYNSGGDRNQSRSLVIRAAVDDDAFEQAVYDSSFVLMQYFGYLQRDPDQSGYDFWLNLLNTHEPDDYRRMVCAFLTSEEYQLRFSSVVSHTNAECR